MRSRAGLSRGRFLFVGSLLEKPRGQNPRGLARRGISLGSPRSGAVGALRRAWGGTSPPPRLDVAEQIGNDAPMAAKNRVGFSVVALIAAIGTGLAFLLRKADTVTNPTLPNIDTGDTPAGKRNTIIMAAGSQLGATDPAPYWQEVYGSYPGRNYAWCGVFALWALHVAGVTDQAWKVGIGFIYPLGLKQTPVPEPGDIAYFQKNQHHAIVASVNSDGTVSLINGNGTGGAVSESRPDIEDVTAFYSIGTLL